jgi:bifunctional N-acetylglucosamine-1-phosphate-uridyltransferase/glucosamine-1-phosphate-acetyltransferase GlmU-like protein
MNVKRYINNWPDMFSNQNILQPWQITANLSSIIFDSIDELNEEYIIKNGIAIHLSANIESGVVIKAPAIISANCFIGANAYLRSGVYLSHNVGIGPGCEIKSCYIGNNTAAAHFNFLGDSLIGSNVNFEAGSVIANHFNERQMKEIIVVEDGRKINTGVIKFGALVGDGCKIGANAVLSPGTVLLPDTVVKRLELVDQMA